MTDNQRTTIYCYTVKHTFHYYKLGFMNAANHDWDEDCFHELTSNDDFATTMTKIDKILSDHEWNNDLINQDNDNWQYLIDSYKVSCVKAYMSSFPFIK